MRVVILGVAALVFAGAAEANDFNCHFRSSSESTNVSGTERVDASKDFNKIIPLSGNVQGVYRYSAFASLDGVVSGESGSSFTLNLNIYENINGSSKPTKHVAKSVVVTELDQVNGEISLVSRFPSREEYILSCLVQ